MDEIDPDSDNCYIFSTPATHWHDGIERRGWDNPRARIICYLLEWYLDVDYSGIPGVELWSPDQWWAERIGARYVPFGSHPGLALEPLPTEREYEYDVAMLSYMTNRRLETKFQLGAAIRFAPNAWGQERHNILARTRMMLHVHQNDGVLTCAPQRFALAAAYRMPLVTERLENCGVYGHKILWSNFEYLPSFTKMWLKDDHSRELDSYGYELYHLLCERHTFKSCVDAAL
jgi:hypothetical protein